MQSLSKANIQVKTLFSLLDHFAIMLGYFWNSFTREKKYTGRHEMSLWKNYLIFFGCKKKKKTPVGIQSICAPLPLLLFII